MTKKERETVQNQINKISDFQKKEDMYFEKLQKMNGEIGSGKRWCCAEMNLKDLLAAGKTEAIDIYSKYIEYRVAGDYIRDFGCDLARIGFWKERNA